MVKPGTAGKEDDDRAEGGMLSGREAPSRDRFGAERPYAGHSPEIAAALSTATMGRPNKIKVLQSERALAASRRRAPAVLRAAERRIVAGVRIN
jgi:hypothetical protein